MKKYIFIAGLLAVFVLTGIGCITIGPSAGKNGGGVFKSPNKGKTWNQANTAPTAEGVGNISSVNVVNLVFDPQESSAIYLASAGSGLFYSWDSAKTWKYVDSLGTGLINSVAIDYSDKCTLYTAVQNRIFKSSDCTRTWQSTYFDTRANVYVNYLAVDPYNNRIVYAGLSNGDLLKSLDSGASWSRIYGFKNKIQKILIHPANSNIVFVGLQSAGLWKSTNKGATWKDLRENMNKFSGSHEIFDIDATNTGNTIYLTTKYGIIKTTNSGETWTDIKLLTAPNTVRIYSFVLNPNNANEIYYATGSTFYSSSDGGQNWITKQLPTNRAGAALLVDPKNANTIYLGTRSFKK